MPVAAAPAPPATSPPWKLAIGLLIGVAALTAGTTWWLMSSPPNPEPVRRFQIPYPAETDFQSGFTLGVALSPPGTHLAFNAGRRLWLRQIGDLVAEEIRGTQGARVPFFSPDGQQLGFWHQDQIKRVAIGGGAAVSLGAAPARAHGAHWGDDGFVYYGQGADGILRVSANGGQPESVVETEEGQIAGAPHLLPGSEWMLFTLRAGDASWDESEILALSLATGERKPLVAGGSDGRYVPTGHIVYALAGNLLAVPFDPVAVEVVGGPVSLVEGVRSSTSGSAQYSFSDRGGLAYMPGGTDQGIYQLSWVGRDGDPQPLPFDPRASGTVALSPDGRRIAVEVADGGGGGEWDIWVLEVERGGQLRLTSDGGSRYPVWSADGEWVYFARGDATSHDIWRQRSDRSQPAEVVLEAEGGQSPRAISSDGKWLAYGQGGVPRRDIGLVALGEEAAPQLIVATEADEGSPSFSPDGSFICYYSSESGSYAVYAKELASGRVWAVSTQGGAAAVWSADGTEIFWVSGIGAVTVWGAAVTYDSGFSVSEPYELFDVRRRNFSNFAVTADGQHFLFSVPATVANEAQRDQGPQINVVLNWFEELTVRVPTGR